ncbi:MAG TPA: protein-export chaperone SecB [Gammaproteobacteria bacterium]|nr:protein-export chaperone SecB [Gammaproteobacteria bacterium]
MTDLDQPTAGAPRVPTDTQRFLLERIYLKDCSFESPLSPTVFQEPVDAPDAHVNLQTQINALADRPEAREVVLSVGVEARSGERSLFVCEVQMAAVVTLDGLASSEEGAILGARVPEALFPFARQAVCDLVVRGGFLPVMLQPIDFDAVYRQHASQQGRPLDS